MFDPARIFECRQMVATIVPEIEPFHIISKPTDEMLLAAMPDCLAWAIHPVYSAAFRNSIVGRWQGPASIIMLDEATIRHEIARIDFDQAVQSICVHEAAHLTPAMKLPIVTGELDEPTPPYQQSIVERLAARKPNADNLEREICAAHARRFLPPVDSPSCTGAPARLRRQNPLRAVGQNRPHRRTTCPAKRSD